MNKRLLTIAAIVAGIALSGCSGDSKDKDESGVITPPSIDTELVENLSHVFNVDPQIMESICSDDELTCSYDESASNAQIGMKNFITLDYNLDTSESILKEKIEFLYAKLSTKPISDFMLERPYRVLHRFTFVCKQNQLCGRRPDNDYLAVEKLTKVDKTEKTSEGITTQSWVSLKDKDYTDLLTNIINADGRYEMVTISESISGVAWSENTSCNNFEAPDECSDRWNWTTLGTSQHGTEREGVKNFFEVVLQENQRQYTGE